jgi:GNAT superfamily N-acetyltransferase
VETLEAATEAKPYTFRPYTTNDIPFIQSSWGNSYYKGASYHTFMEPDSFHSFHRPIREAFFERPETAAIVCVAKDDSDLILGWIAVERPPKPPGIMIHYLYVKEAFKRQGIATELISAVGASDLVMHTHLTERADRIMFESKPKFKNWVYTPHLLKLGGHQ